MRIEFQYSPDEYYRAVWLHYRQGLSPKLDIFASILCFIIGIAFLNRGNTPIAYILISVSILLLGLIIAARFIIPRIIFNNHPKYREQYTLEFSEEGITFKTASIDSKLLWSLYNRAVIDSEHYLLYHGKNTFTVIPKRTLQSHDDLRRFESLITAKLGDNIARVG